MPQRMMVIRDTKNNILNTDKYPFAEGQTFYAIDSQQYYIDQGLNRSVISREFSIIEGDFQITSTTPTDHLFITSRPSGGYQMIFIDGSGEAHTLTENVEDIQNITGRDGLNGINTYVLNLYSLTDENFEDISTISPPSNVSGTYNFQTRELSNLSVPSGWTDDLEELDLENAMFSDDDGSYQVDLGSNLVFSFSKTASDIKVIVSQVLLISRSFNLDFENKIGDIPSKWREGMNSAIVYLYYRTNDEDSGSLPAIEFNSKYNYLTQQLSDLDDTDFNGWNVNFLEPTEANPYVFIRAVSVSSNKTISYIPANQWTNARLFTRFGTPGEPGENGESGDDGFTVVNGTVYFKDSTEPDTPMGDYNIDTDSYTFSDGWSRSVEFEASSQDTYWRSDFHGSGLEGTIILTFTAPTQAINFSGLVTFTESGGELSASNSNITSINGGLLSTARIDSSAVISASNPRMTINLNDQYLSVGQSPQGYGEDGIFLGYDSNFPRFSLIDSSNHLIWTGTQLDIEGDIGGNIGKIEIGTAEENGILISDIGIQAWHSNELTFQLTTSGNAQFSGHIESESGKIGPFTITNTALSSSNISGSRTEILGGGQGIELLDHTEQWTTKFFPQNISVETGVGEIGGNFYINGVTVGGGSSSLSIKENIAPVNLDKEIKLFLDNIIFKQYNYKYGLYNNDYDIGFIIEDLEYLNVPRIKESILYKPRKILVSDSTNNYYHKTDLNKPEDIKEITIKEYDVDSLLKIALMSVQYNNKQIKKLEKRISKLESMLYED